MGGTAHWYPRVRRNAPRWGSCTRDSGLWPGGWLDFQGMETSDFAVFHQGGLVGRSFVGSEVGGWWVGWWACLWSRQGSR